MTLKISTWNINSVRLRINSVLRFLDEEQPDVLCLQESKTPDEFFPTEALDARGYTHRLIHGMKSYNGIAVLSRLPFVGEAATPGWCEKIDCRHGVVRLEDGTELHNLYVPAGGDVPDPEVNVKFAHKLRFLDEITEWLAARAANGNEMILVGDLNIAPLEQDVWSHKQLLTVVSHTPVEVDRLEKLRQAGGFHDAVRHFVPGDQKLYSWWSYRNRDWSLSDRGRRLDHIWVTAGLMPSLAEAHIRRDVRGWERASDHVPVSVQLG